MVFKGLLDKEYLSLCTTFFKALHETTMQYNWTQARSYNSHVYKTFAFAHH